MVEIITAYTIVSARTLVYLLAVVTAHLAIRIRTSSNVLTQYFQVLTG